MARGCWRAAAARPARPPPPFRGEARSCDRTGCRRSCEKLTAALAAAEIARRRPLGGSSAELAADDVLAAHVARLFAEVERPRHGGPHAVRRRPCRSPPVGDRHHFLPVVRALRNVGGI